MKVSEMPVGLMSYSWAGSLPVQLYRHNRATMRLAAGVIALVAVLVAGGMYAVTGDASQLILAFPVFTLAITFALPVIYAMSVRDVRILRRTAPGTWDLDMTHWWKQDVARLDEHMARYERGKRVFWLVEPPGDPEAEIEYFGPEILNPRRTNAAVDASEVYGLAGFVASGSAYVFRKARSLQDAVKLGILGLVIGGELIALFMLAGNITNA